MTLLARWALAREVASVELGYARAGTMAVHGGSSGAGSHRGAGEPHAYAVWCGLSAREWAGTPLWNLDLGYNVH